MAQPMMQPGVEMVAPGVAPQAAQAVYGLNIVDHRLAMLTRRVLNLAGFMILLALISLIVNLASINYAEIRHDCRHSEGFDRLEEECFKGWSLVVGCVLAFLLSLVVPCCGWNGAKKNDTNCLCCFCGCNLIGGACNACSLLSVVTGAAFSADTTVATGVLVLIALPGLIIQCAAFWWGNELYSELKRGVVIHHPPAVVYTQHAVQPAVQYAQPVVVAR
jgi:uncharacterized membrane protein YidH (DUF202 family)